VQNKASHEGNNGTIEPGGRPLKVAVVDREHHRATRARIEHARKAVLHAPVELVRALQKEPWRLLHLVCKIAISFNIGFRHHSPRDQAATLDQLTSGC